MKKLIIAASALVTVMATGACKVADKYECTIRDARTGEVIRKYNVAFKSQCIAL